MKSQTEFNWIFIIITGAIILSFFTVFAFKYKLLQEEKISIETLQNIDNSLTSLQSTPFNTIDTINLPFKLELDCSKLKINDEEYESNNLLFSEKILNNEMNIWYRPFKLPFKITNFYYIVDKETKINLVYNSNSQAYVNDLINDLPTKFKSHVTSSMSPSKEKNIYFYETTAKIKVIPNEKIIFNNKEYKFNEDLVYSIMFDDSFECNYKKIQDDLNKVVEVYKKKATLLQNKCNYSSLITYLDKLKDNFDNAKQIETINKELVGKNCPSLY